MINPREKTVDFQKYLKKLRFIIEREALFTFMDLKIVDKQKIDDVWCCLQASWPNELKDYVVKVGKKNVKSQVYYDQLYKAVKNKFFFSSTCYKVDVHNAISAITSLATSIERDMQFIYNEQSGMF